MEFELEEVIAALVMLGIVGLVLVIVIGVAVSNDASVMIKFGTNSVPVEVKQ